MPLRPKSPPLFEKLSGALEPLGTRFDRQRGPIRETCFRCRHRGGRDRRIALAHLADDRAVDGRSQRTDAAGERNSIDQRRRRVRKGSLLDLGDEPRERRAVAELDPGRVPPHWRVEIARQRDLHMAGLLR